MQASSPWTAHALRPALGRGAAAVAAHGQRFYKIDTFHFIPCLFQCGTVWYYNAVI